MPIITGLGLYNDALYDENQTYAPVRQSNIPAADKTVAMPIERIVRDVKTSIANATAAIQTAQDTADAAIPLTQKGVANGVATLDASGKVPASQLTVIATSFKGNWNATTNSPALSDGTGTGGDFYFVQSGTSRNLGSGAITWTTGAMIIHNGTAWVENEATNDVLSVNGLQGVVVLDADDIAETTNKNYVTDDQADALDASSLPSASNPLITQSDLDAAIAAISSPGIVVIGGAYTPDNFNDGVNDGGTGELKLLNTLGYTNGTAAAQWPLAAAMYGGTIDVTTTSYDDVRFASWLEGARYGIIYDLEVLPNKAYAFNKGNLRIPAGKDTPLNTCDSQQYKINFRNALYKNQSGVAFTTAMFHRTPSTQTDANSNFIDQRWVIEGGKFEGVAGDIGIKFGASRSSEFRNMEFQNFDYGIQGAMNLNVDFHKVNTSSCREAGIHLTDGWWTSANVNNSISQATFHRCRFRTTATTQIGILVEAFDTSTINDCQFEGTAGEYAIFINVNSAATVNKFFTIRNLRLEVGGGTKYTNAIVGYRGRSTRRLVIDTVFSQDAAGSEDTILLECENTQGTMNYKIAGVLENTGSGSLKLKQTNSGGAGSYTFEDVHFQGNPTTAAEHVAPGNSVWTADSDLPSAARVTVISPYKP